MGHVFFHFKNMLLSCGQNSLILNFNPAFIILATWCKELTHWKRAWCWERLRARAERGDKGWDGWMAFPTQWTWVWANFMWKGRTGKLGVLSSMGWQSGTKSIRCKIGSKKLLCNTGSPGWDSVMTKKGGLGGAEAGLGGKGYIYTHGWFVLLYGRNQHSIGKQLSSN